MIKIRLDRALFISDSHACGWLVLLREPVVVALQLLSQLCRASGWWISLFATVLLVISSVWLLVLAQSPIEDT